MGYKARYLLDTGSGDTFTDEEGNVNLTGSTGATWITETGDPTYTGNGPYKMGELGNPSPGKSTFSLTGQTSYKLTGTPTAWGNAFTITCWAKITGSSGTTEPLFSNFNGIPPSGKTHLSIYINTVAAKVVVASLTGDGSNPTYTTITESGTLTGGLWYFFVVSFSGSGNVNLYYGDNKNTGVPNSPVSWSLSSASGAAPTFTSNMFGSYVVGKNNPADSQFTGDFDNLRIFDTELSSGDRNNLYLYNSLNGESYGDVHVKPLKGVSYDMHTLGYHKWLHDGKDMYINVETQYGKYKRWGKNDYATKMFIKNGNDDILINTGFRGDPVEVINYHNKDNTITYELKELEFDEKAKNHCSECTFGSGNKELIKKHEIERKHYFPKMTRNMISINIKTKDNEFKVTVKNINKINVQPSIISVTPKNFANYDKWSGFIVGETKGVHLDNIIDC